MRRRKRARRRTYRPSLSSNDPNNLLHVRSRDDAVTRDSVRSGSVNPALRPPECGPAARGPPQTRRYTGRAIHRGVHNGFAYARVPPAARRCPWLVCALLLLVGVQQARRPGARSSGKEAGRRRSAAAKGRDSRQGFALASANAEQYEGQLALILEFTQPIVGTQAFDTLIAVTGPKGENVQGSWALDEDGKTLRFPYVQADASYTVRIKADLAAVDGKTLGSEVTKEIYTGPMQPNAGFASQGSVLPARETRGLPVVSVNVKEVDVEFLRVRDKEIANFFAAYQKNGKRSGYELDPRYGWYGRKGKPVAGIADSVYANRFVLSGKDNERTLNYLPIQNITELVAARPLLRGHEARRQLRRRIRDELLLRQRHRHAHARVQGSAVRACGVAEDPASRSAASRFRCSMRKAKPSSPAQPIRTATRSSPMRSTPSRCWSRAQATTSRCCRSTSRRSIFPTSPSPAARKPGSTCSAGPIAISIGRARRFAFPRCCAITTAIRSSRSRCS